MPQAFALPIILRLLATAAFLIAAAYAGAINRSFLIVPLLAISAVAAQTVASLIAPSPITGLKAAFDPGAIEPPLAKKAGKGFAGSLIGYGIVFALSAGIAALFQETEFVRGIELQDLMLSGGAGLIALSCSVLSSKLGASQVVGVMQSMQTAFAEMKATSDHHDDDSFTVEGEIIEPDEPRS